jgi:hypothetical protein
MAKRTRISLFGISLVFLLAFSSQLSVGQVIQTPSEKTGFQEYSSYEDMMGYLEDLQATTTEMLLSDFGTTIEGRKQPYAVFSRPLITQPWEAMTSGKPIVVLAANIHGGERTVRESLLLIAREFVTPGTPMHALLDDLIIVMVPTINPDGLVRATRGNSQGVDVNRDWIKLEQPALYNYVRNILLTWNPHLFLDGHNGGSQPYNICYQGPQMPLVTSGSPTFATRKYSRISQRRWKRTGIWHGITRVVTARNGGPLRHKTASASIMAASSIQSQFSSNHPVRIGKQVP